MIEIDTRRTIQYIYDNLFSASDRPDTGKLARQSERLMQLCTLYGSDPFVRLNDARRRLGLERAEFTELLEIILSIPRLSSLVTELVTGAQAGSYWADTILPLESKGVFDAVLENRPVYPSVVGLYPGPTCMFRCHFCIRVTGARYDTAQLHPGTDCLADLVENAPVDDLDRFYVSGGLEPLSNPRIGELATRAARRGFNVMLYTNSFALTERTLDRQPGIWDFGAIRTSLYGLTDEEYHETVGRPRAFRRVQENLVNLIRLRDMEQRPVRLGLSYLVLPGRVCRLTALLDFLRYLRDTSGGHGIDFLSLRQDYSGRPKGLLLRSERKELLETLGYFNDVLTREFPMLRVDYGYALSSMLRGADAQLPRITVEEMRPMAHPQVSVQVDLLGDVYLYREAGFPDLLGGRRYVCGKVDKTVSLDEVITQFISNGKGVEPVEGDQFFLDGFDQVVVARLNQLSDDMADGWGKFRGFLR